MKDSTRHFWRSRLGSFFAVAPLGVWTIIHLWNNLAAWKSPEAWEAAVTEHSHPIAQGIIYFVVLFPLVYHTIWGLARIGVGRPNNAQYNSYANLKFLLQRLSAIGVLLFIGAHLWLAFLKPRLIDGHAEAFADISREMRFHGPTLMVYILGTLGVSYHLANGIQTFGMKLGLRWARRPSDRGEWPYLVLFFVLLAMSWAAIYGLYRAAS
jgi:succinate dehydrogenase / fumarate reductase, cytochrome b subunit